MIRTLLKSKIHRATVTEADVDYNGSITIDSDLMAAAQLVTNERVEVYDITNGNRLATYAIPGPAGSGTICLNGAAAKLVDVGDLVIICCYAHYFDEEVENHQAIVVHVDDKNEIVEAVSK